MELRLHADSADLAAVEPLLREGLVRGVTTNPTLLARAGRSAEDRAELARKWHEQGAEEVFFQAVGQDADALLADAEAIAELGCVVKVPATRAGFATARQLADQHVPTLVTAVYTTAQAIVAASLGVSYVAPYLGRLDDGGVDGAALIGAMQRAVAQTETRLLVASVRSPDDVERLVAVGVSDITAAPTVWLDCLSSPESDRAVADFDRDAGLVQPAYS